MLICNLCQFDPNLNLSRQAGAEFFSAGASLYSTLAALEGADIDRAVSQGKETAAALNAASSSFLRLADLVRNQYRWIADETRRVDFADAARQVHLPPDSPIVRELTSMLLAGDIVEVLVRFAQHIRECSAQVKGVAERIAGGDPVWDHEYRVAHELLRDWRELTIRGQFVSSVCLAATRQAVR